MKIIDLSKTEQYLFFNMEAQINNANKHMNACSYQTRSRYKDGMKDFAKFLAKDYHKQKISKVNNEHIKAYVKYLQDNGYSKSYVTTNVSAIRYYYDKTLGGKFRIWNNKKLGVIPRTKADRIGEDKSLTEEVYRELLTEAEKNGPEYGLMIRASKQFGLRISEAFKLRHSQINKAITTFSLEVKGKGGLTRYIPLSYKDIELLKEINTFNTSGNDRIFVGTKEMTHIKIKELQRLIIKIRGTNKYTFHSIRYTFANNLYKKLRNHGMSDYEARKEVSKQLGHHRIDITEIYLN